MGTLYMKLRIPDREGWMIRAQGKGKVHLSKPFDVEINDGKVEASTTYMITETPDGDSPYRFLSNANAGVGQTVSFKNVGTLLASIDDEFAVASRALQSVLSAAQKKVNILIEAEDYDMLKDSNYRLCFAKRVGESDFNVVWQAYKEYLETNDFSWTPQYQIFGSNVFIDNITVKVSTKVVEIGLGETSILTENGRLLPAETGGPITSLNLDNQYGRIHPGVNQLATGVDGEQVSKPIYVSPVPIVKGLASLTPKESVLVWFEQNIETSTMFSSSRSKAVEIDLTNESEATRLYTDQKWVKISG